MRTAHTLCILAAAVLLLGGCLGKPTTPDGAPARVELTRLVSPDDAKAGWYTLHIHFRSNVEPVALAGYFRESRIAWDEEKYVFPKDETRRLRLLSWQEDPDGGFSGVFTLPARTGGVGTWNQCLSLVFGGGIGETNQVCDTLTTVK